MKNQKNVVKGSVETICPEVAGYYLERKGLHKNRKISEERVNTYLKLIEGNEWFVGEPLMFDDGDNLLNGHHRLRAVIRSGKSVDFYVIRNVDPNILKYVDTGKVRRGCDILTMEGVRYPQTVNSGLKIMSGIKANSKYITRFNLSNAELTLKYIKESDFIDSMSQFAFSMQKNLGSKFMSSGYILGYILSKNNEELREKAIKFFKLLCSDDTDRAYILTKFREDLLRGAHFSSLSKNNRIHLMVETLFNSFITSESKFNNIKNYPRTNSIISNE